MSAAEPVVPARGPADAELSPFDVVATLARHWMLVLLVPLLIGLLALGATYAMKPMFTAKTTILPPQQQQSAAVTALASLGALSGLAGIGPTRTSGDQYVALLESVTIQDRLIDEFKLMDIYDAKVRSEARKDLDRRVRVLLGKRDGLITIEVDDERPERAAAMANRHVDELRRLTSSLALTEAQQRRVFFEGQLKETTERLTRAQLALEASGFNAGALRAEPRAAAEGYARLQAEVTAAEVRLQTLRRSLTDAAPEVQQQQSTVSALRSQLARLEASDRSSGAPGYVSRYREFKYQEALFDLFARQYEMARLDESREGALIQVVDPALPPDTKSRPRRALVAAAATAAAFVLLCLFVLVRHASRRARAAAVEPGPALPQGAAGRG